jgi:hypothetical protein
MDMVRTTALSTTITSMPLAPMPITTRAAPSIGSTTRDSWECYTENIEQYFQGPDPSGALNKALFDYGDILNADCTITIPSTGLVLPTCPFPGREKWCEFSTAAPSSVMPAWSTFGSAVASWWAANSESVSSLAEYCPNRWKSEMAATPYGELWLNNTIAWAECYVEAHATSTAIVTASGSEVTAPTVSVGAHVLENHAVGRMGNVEFLAVAGAGLVAVVSSMLYMEAQF